MNQNKPKKGKNKALFMDLDWTLIRPKGLTRFPKHKDDWLFMPNIIKAIYSYLRQNPNIRHLIIVSNQGGIEAGYITEEDVIDKISTIVRRMYKFFEKDYPDLIIGFSYSKTMKIENTDRKPNPDMAYHSAILYDLDLSQSVMVGDASGKKYDHSDSDKKFAENAGLLKYYDVKEFIDTYAPTAYQS